MTLDETIVAISTPPGRGAIGLVRISGSRALEIGRIILRVRKAFQPRVAALGELVEEAGAVIDRVLATWFPGPHSYTGEDVMEISCHGAPVVLRFCVERALTAGARLAEPGEFTLRAYLNGRLDLPQAEAVRDLIEATTLYQARVAAQQIDGAVSRRLTPVKTQLVELIALLEAGIDFAEDDIDVASDAEILRRIASVSDGVDTMLRSFAYGQLVHDGFTLAIVGRPNVGKSSLFNRLLEQDRAIVTAIPGTTRDTVSEVSAIGGIPVKLLDTAGIREGQDVVESLGIERSWQALTDADLALVVTDATEGLTAEDEVLLQRAQRSTRTLLVANKCDLGPVGVLRVSALTGQGIDELRRRILEEISDGSRIEPESGLITNVRHQILLQECREALVHAEAAVCNKIPHEMLLLDLYAALRPLDGITGATTADDILNRIFSTFCIGK